MSADGYEKKCGKLQIHVKHWLVFWSLGLPLAWSYSLSLSCSVCAAADESPAAGDCWPTQLTHGTLLAWSQKDGKSNWEIATCAEHLGALGFRMHNDDAVFPLSNWKPVLATFESTQVKKLSGNGMHLQTQLAWMLYVLAFCVKKDSDEMPASKSQSSQPIRLGSWDCLTD
eukprot:4476906-Amphidinium_carterae.1